MKTALLVIDIQKDYFPGGKYPLVKPEAAAKNAYMLLQCFREHGGHHVHIQHISLEPDATFFIKGDHGSDIHDLVAHFEGEPITARAASDFGFQVIVAEDACATRDLKYGDTTIPADLVHKSFIAALKSYGRVMKSEEVIALLAGEMVK
jgi:nicotinamidase-related amidase